MSTSVPERASIVIVGGGVMGASIAFHLAEAGVPDVLLVERNELGSGSTVKAAGGVRAQFSDPMNIALGARSLEAFEKFQQRPGRAIDLHQVGYLFLHTTPESLVAAEAAVSLQNSLGVETRMLTSGEAHALSPAIAIDDVVGATFHPRDGYCAPDSVVQGYAAGARRWGATVRSGVAVTGIERHNGDITGVITSAGRVACDAVVCAAGAWSRGIAAMAGVDLPIDPLRRQILITEPLPESLLSLFPENVPMTIDASSTFYFHREGPGILLGMSYAAEKVGFHEGYSEDWLAPLTEAIGRRAPALLDVGIAHRWAGYYEVTPDNNAVIGESSTVSRFLYAAGFSGHGFLQGPAVGEVVRDLWLGRRPVVDVSALTADRFITGATVTEHAIV